jgi:hypothetical protein
MRVVPRYPVREENFDKESTWMFFHIPLSLAKSSANVSGNLRRVAILGDGEGEVHVGQVILGLVIFGIGLYLANLAAKTVEASGVTQAGLLAVAARIAILVLAGAMALREMGLANEIVNLAFGLLLGAIAVAVALAFGLGGRDIAARELEGWLESIKTEENRD